MQFILTQRPVTKTKAHESFILARLPGGVMSAVRHSPFIPAQRVYVHPVIDVTLEKI